MAGRLLCSRRFGIVSAFAFSFYFLMKYYLIISTMDGSASDLLSASEGKHSSVRPLLRPSSNISLDELFNNSGCELDLLGAPPYVTSQGCADQVCEILTCKKLLSGNQESAAAAKKFTDAHLRWPLNDEAMMKLVSNCTEFRLRGGYYSKPVRETDAEFPIAFNILVHWHLEQFERLLRAIYRPQNLYCIHVDAKSSWSFNAAIVQMASCFDNVFVASRRQHVIYAGFSRLQADIDCMKDHLSHSDKWRYLLNTAGQAYPLRTPEEMIDILRIYNGANDIEGISGYRLLRHRYQHEWRESADLDKIYDTNMTNPPPPHDIDIVRGSAYGIFSRSFVDFIVTDKRAQDLLEWSRKTYSPDEHYWATLHHTYSNPHLRSPGGYSDVPDKKPFLAIYVKWYPDKCWGVWKRGVCVFGHGDLPDLIARREFFVNKFAIDYEPLAFECAEAWLQQRLACPLPFDADFYRQLSFVNQQR